VNQIQLNAPRLTAQLIVSDAEAYLAYSWKRHPLGRDGELHLATILHTKDGGSTWTELSWDRTWWSRIRHQARPTWPPEAVMAIERTTKGLAITHRDEWVPYESGGESLWRSQWLRGRWRTSRVRPMSYEGTDSADSVPEIAMQLPASMRLPKLAEEKAEREWGRHSSPP
jgi:hypothetical protein